MTKTKVKKVGRFFEEAVLQNSPPHKHCETFPAEALYLPDTSSHRSSDPHPQSHSLNWLFWPSTPHKFIQVSAFGQSTASKLRIQQYHRLKNGKTNHTGQHLAMYILLLAFESDN